MTIYWMLDYGEYGAILYETRADAVIQSANLDPLGTTPPVTPQRVSVTPAPEQEDAETQLKDGS